MIIIKNFANFQKNHKLKVSKNLRLSKSIIDKNNSEFG